MDFVHINFFVVLQLLVLQLGPFIVFGKVDVEGFETLSKTYLPVAASMHPLSPPYELWKGHAPNIKYLRVCGCLSKLGLFEPKK